MRESELYDRLERLEDRVRYLSSELAVACARIQTLEMQPGTTTMSSLTYDTAPQNESEEQEKA